MNRIVPGLYRSLTGEIYEVYGCYEEKETNKVFVCYTRENIYFLKEYEIFFGKTIREGKLVSRYKLEEAKETQIHSEYISAIGTENGYMYNIKVEEIK